eukprot:CAMPEP_0114599860 /NCGR_PEP_ID=MMETSP0125-20121206/22363_1 /TAXON_ID=485358 ORGANISM="Aristerostoma sp., Strain ATCC 50986" /NCGR_SAMPLE_ID=MMETSP0125 /ASSEMBLY_ACC=CAM_ASM_000245 /LENGTH=87 /DNA_ID=CAMNT_0001807279 /DNA_START=781 /DNA_END=1044 /DNA_ORIENTATION=-
MAPPKKKVNQRQNATGIYYEKYGTGSPNTALNAAPPIAKVIAELPVYPPILSKTIPPATTPKTGAVIEMTANVMKTSLAGNNKTDLI